MESKSAGIIVALIVLAFFATSAYYYPLLPERIASHWNAEGKVNGFMDKTAALLFLPGIAVLLAALFFAIPRIDPLKANIQKFRGHFNNISSIGWSNREFLKKHWRIYSRLFRFYGKTGFNPAFFRRPFSIWPVFIFYSRPRKVPWMNLEWIPKW